MPRCASCGRESPPGSLFCLNCGTRFSTPPPQTPEETQGGGAGLPRRCPSCATENPPGMNFCRNCGLSLGPPPAAAPRPAAGPPPGAAPPAAPGYTGGRMPSPASIVGAHNQPQKSATGSVMVTCSNCGGQTPGGFAFCQQCGGKLAAPPAPGGPPQGVVSGQTGGSAPHVSPDAVAATLAARGAGEAAAMMRQPGPPPAQPQGGYGPPPGAADLDRDTAAEPVAAWGTLISVKRDGTDGERHPLSGEWFDIGREDAHLSFDDDSFLARRHARLEYGERGARLIPLDELNGVYRRLEGATPIEDGAMILVGREVMRFEVVSDAERDVVPLIRHGVALFGSPPRSPWGRLLLLLPNAGVRDVRFLEKDEIVIGREEGDLVFRDDAFLSRRHVALRHRDGRYVVEDLKSSNGTFLRLDGPTDLRSGDHLRLGDQLFRFEMGSSGGR